MTLRTVIVLFVTISWWVSVAHKVFADDTVTVIEGFTRPAREVDVAAHEPGVLEELDVKLGDRVTAGQRLGRLHDQQLRAACAIAASRAEDGSRIAMRTAELELSERRHQRLLELAERGSARPDEVERGEVELRVARARLEEARLEQQLRRLELDELQSRLQLREIRAPFAGIVRELLVQPGEVVPASSPAVVRLADIDQLRLRINVPLQEARQLASADHPSADGDDRELTPDNARLIEVVDVTSGTRLQGRVVFIDPHADAASGTVRVELLLPNPGGVLRSGTRCRVQLSTR